MRKALPVLFLSIVLVLIPEEPKANIFGDIWNGVKSVATGIGSLIGAPFGGLIQGATAPAVDHAAAAIREVADHATDRIDAVMQGRLSQFDDIAKNRIAQIDDVLKNRLDQANEMMNDRLQQMDQILGRTLDREAAILDSSVTRIDDLLTKDIDRIDDLQKDAFNNVQAALEDQVPIATSQVARQIEWTIVAAVFLIVLVGFGGVQLYRQLSKHRAKPFRQRLAAAFDDFWPAAVPVAVQMVAITFLIQLAYIGYYKTADHQRLDRLAAAATSLENIGDFKAALAFRHRLLALDADADSRYFVARDAWLGDFVQSRRLPDPSVMMLRLDGFAPENRRKSDGELEAAYLYLMNRIRSHDDAAPASLEDEVNQYRNAFLTSSKSRPFLGKLAAMAAAELALENRKAAVIERYKAADGIAAQIETLYPNYAQAHILHSQLASALLDAESWSYSYRGAAKRAGETIERDVDLAAKLDPDLARVLRVSEMRMPEDLLTELEKRDPGAGADLDQFVNHVLMPEAVAVLHNESLARVKAEEQLTYMAGRDLGERRMKSLVIAARALQANPNATRIALFNACVEVAKQARKINDDAIADEWAVEAQHMLDNLDQPTAQDQQKVADLLRDIRSADPRRIFVVL